MNLQCSDRVNMANAVECKGCGRNLRNVKMEFLDEKEIEKRLNPPAEEEMEQEGVLEEATSSVPQMVVICPSCNTQTPYQIGLEFCECGEYIADVPPVIPGQEEVASATAEPVSVLGVSSLGVQSGVSPIPSIGAQSSVLGSGQMMGNICVSGMTSLDGLCNILFCQDYMVIGRERIGHEYFGPYGKGKVSREHIIVRRIESAWYLSYVKKINGGENAVYVNDRMIAREEECRLQNGDVIALGSNEKTDPYAAFFRVQ